MEVSFGGLGIPTFYFNSAYTALSDSIGVHLGVRK
jgi:hypothetical protein